MERLHLLSVALGLATLAGINLYLTVFATGIAIHFHWITLAPEYQSLEVLGNPWIISVAGVLWFLEFFADKIPWVDSIWDAVHTVIRPIGAALLAIQVLGHPNPTFTVIVGLLAGGTALVSHTAKAATRLTTNTSPEPFSNIALSVTEDAAVLGGLALIHLNPVLALSIFAVAIAAFFYFAPKILRAMKARVWLAWKKLNGPASVHFDAKLPVAVPSNLTEEFTRQNVLGETIAWAVPCISGRGRRIPANIFGALIALNENPRKLFFLGRKGRRAFTQKIDLEATTVSREPNFLSEDVVIAPLSGKGAKYLFIFPRSDAELVTTLVDDLSLRARTPIWPVNETQLEEQEAAAS